MSHCISILRNIIITARNSSCRKVMFSQACHSVHRGGGLGIVQRGVGYRIYNPPHPQTRDLYLPPPMDMEPIYPTRTLPLSESPTVAKRAVRILLDC